jgi:acyl dehydratase/NAD(P)-dependent dehydrogenase (short-subunit alcohol dehydrogenase family)
MRIRSAATMSPKNEFSISASDSAGFARLSGDYNPLHLDRLAARRTQFGDTVVHGIHLLLATLDRTADRWCRNGAGPAALSFAFSNPVRTGASVVIRVTAEPDGSRFRFVAESEQRVAFTATVELDSTLPGPPHEPEDAESPPAAAWLESFPPTRPSGTVPLRLARAQLASLFPSLSVLKRRSWIADLLATTRIVGMHCPGLHSVYSTGKLRRAGNSDAASMSYRIERTDDRFQMVRMSVEGAELGGQIEALFRPAPVAQPSAQQIASSVAADIFKEQRALVIGGSRGLGELTAKIIAAGGGQVTITYSKGREDAESICAEASQLGRVCNAQQLDVTRVDELPEWLAHGSSGLAHGSSGLAEPFTHVYFFASPPIPRNTTGRWNHPVFEQLSDVYVRAFAAIAHKVLSAEAPPKRALRFLYPSSVFLDEYEKGFAEYCVAKAAGEALCLQLERQYGVLFARPRLPRMRTDQTSGVRDAAMPDTFAVMYETLRQFCLSSARPR